MLGALYEQPLGDRGGSGPSSRLAPYLIGQCPGSTPVLPRPRPATDTLLLLRPPGGWQRGRAALIVVSSGRYLAPRVHAYFLPASFRRACPPSRLKEKIEIRPSALAI
jgi:hypothetical protein